MPLLDLEEKDIKDAMAVQAMMQTEGWKVLKQYWDVQKESFIDRGMLGIQSRIHRGQSDMRWAILNGFSEAILLPEYIVKRAEEFINRQPSAEEKEPLHDEQL